MTDWFRTEAYYASGGWRATWKGEGGGVLLNQCLHNLDAMQWLLGMPARVRGFCQLGRFHNIEVEDNVSAYLEYGDGATGTFVSSTGEAPGTNRFEIVGTRGKVVLEADKLSFTRNESDMFEFSRTAKLGFAKPEVWNVEIPFENALNSACHVDAELRQRDPRGRTADCAGRGRHPLGGAGQRDSLFVADRPDGGAADGQRGVREEAQGVDCRLDDREEGGGGLQ